MARMLGSKMMSVGSKPACSIEELVRALADLHLALDRVRLAGLVERHHHDAGAVAADRARLLEEVVLPFLQADRVDDALALHALQPGLEHRPLRAVDHTGTRAISGSVAMKFRNVVIACSESSMPSSMLTSIMLAPPRTCSAATLTASV